MITQLKEFNDVKIEMYKMIKKDGMFTFSFGTGLSVSGYCPITGIVEDKEQETFILTNNGTTILVEADGEFGFWSADNKKHFVFNF